MGIAAILILWRQLFRYIWVPLSHERSKYIAFEHTW